MKNDKVKRKYKPNHIPAWERSWNILLSSLLLIYGTFGVLTGDIGIPSLKRAYIYHFHGEPLWILYCSFLCAAANLLTIVADHRDKRDNEKNYKMFARVTQILGWILFVLAFILMPAS